MYDIGDSPRRDFFDYFREYDPEEEERVMRMKGIWEEDEYEDYRDDCIIGIDEELVELGFLEDILEDIRRLFEEKEEEKEEE